MSETILVAVVGACGVVAGGLVTALSGIVTGKRETDVKSSELLLDAQLQLKATMADNELLWAYNRRLVDWIYRRKGPPPPAPPEDLFDHHDQ